MCLLNSRGSWVNRTQPDDGAKLDTNSSGATVCSSTGSTKKAWVCCWLNWIPTSYQQAVKAINVEYDRLWRDDGGRDGKPDDVRAQQHNA